MSPQQRPEWCEDPSSRNKCDNKDERPGEETKVTRDRESCTANEDKQSWRGNKYGVGQSRRLETRTVDIAVGK